MDILNDFVIEAEELLQDAEDAMMDIENSKDLSTKYKIVFRSLHSLKGGAGMMGLDSLQRHTHLLEDHLSKYQNNLNDLPHVVDFFLKGIDCARSILRGEEVNFNYDLEKTDHTSSKQVDVIDHLKKLGIKVSSIGALEGAKIKKNYRTISEYIKNKGWLSEDLIILSSKESLSELEKLDILAPFIQIIDDHSKKSLNVTNFTENQIGSLSFFYQQNAEIVRTLERAIQLMLYQFVDMEVFLKNEGKISTLNTLRKEIFDLLSKKQKIIGF